MQWKTGVEETRLNEFQLTQSQDGVPCPFVPLMPPQPIQPMPVSCQVPWDEMMLRADQAITAIVTNPIANRVTPTAKPLPSQAMTFMQGRPEGSHQCMEQAMRSQEHQVSI
jgi:hypothetical protein